MTSKKILVVLPEYINKKVEVFKAQNNMVTKADAIVEMLNLLDISYDSKEDGKKT